MRAPPPPFERSVFVNAPFDEDFAPLLQAICFCIVDLGFTPRLAPENADNAANRLLRIIELIRGSKFGIHDLSRCKSSEVDEYSRMNMPFELGLDHGCAIFGSGRDSGKTILILEHTRYDYQKALSDISGWDIEAHKGEFLRIVRIVIGWLVRHAEAEPIGASRVQAHYATFQEWYWEREADRGSSEDDIRAYPTVQVVEAMQEWMLAGRPD